MQLNIGQRLPASAFVHSLIRSPSVLLTLPIGKTYTVKINASVCHIHDRPFRVADIRLFLKYLLNSPYARQHSWQSMTNIMDSIIRDIMIDMI